MHAAIIMDGNGRWAAARGLPRLAGHRAGAHAVRRAVEAAPGLGITTLTLYAFSQDNWKRPAAEVQALLRLLRVYLLKETSHCQRNGVRISLIGRRDRLPAALLPAIERAEATTKLNARLHLRLAIDYSARAAIAAAAACGAADEESLSEALGPDVDLLVRTSGEQRLSDFLLWECAYAEFVFLDTLWPDFTGEDLARAVAEFRRRDRRFGGLTGRRPA
jgi:undecaprenyl diphosphate synthase